MGRSLAVQRRSNRRLVAITVGVASTRRSSHVETCYSTALSGTNLKCGHAARAISVAGSARPDGRFGVAIIEHGTEAAVWRFEAVGHRTTALTRCASHQDRRSQRRSSDTRFSGLTATPDRLDVMTTIGLDEYANAVLAAGSHRPRHRRADRLRDTCLVLLMTVVVAQDLGVATGHVSIPK